MRWFLVPDFLDARSTFAARSVGVAPRRGVVTRAELSFDGQDPGAAPFGQSSQIVTAQGSRAGGGRHVGQHALGNRRKAIGERPRLGEYVERQVGGKRIGAERGYQAGVQHLDQRRKLDLDEQVGPRTEHHRRAGCNDRVQLARAHVGQMHQQDIGCEQAEIGRDVHGALVRHREKRRSGSPSCGQIRRTARDPRGERPFRKGARRGARWFSHLARGPWRGRREPHRGEWCRRYAAAGAYARSGPGQSAYASNSPFISASRMAARAESSRAIS